MIVAQLSPLAVNSLIFHKYSKPAVSTSSIFIFLFLKDSSSSKDCWGNILLLMSEPSINIYLSSHGSLPIDIDSFSSTVQGMLEADTSGGAHCFIGLYSLNLSIR